MHKLDHSNNNFDFLRIIGALFVFCSHSFAAIGLPEPMIFAPYKKFPEINLGVVGVSIFFVVSGFLITMSLKNSDGLRSFFIKRIGRIYPAYWVNLLITVFLLGPLVSSLPMREYFHQLAPLLELVYHNVRGILWFTIPPLPGVFESNPKPFLVNGSLWTLPLEVLCYLGVVFLDMVGWLNRKLFFIVAVMVIAYNVRAYFNDGFYIGNLHYCSFVLGAFCYIYWDRIKFNLKYFMVAVALFLAMFVLDIYFSPAYLILTTYIVICFGLMSGRFAKVSKYGDFSYGMYIYSWPVQQTFAQYYKFDKSMFVYYFISSFIVVMILSILSWKLVEAPVLRKVRSKSKRPLK